MLHLQTGGVSQTVALAIFLDFDGTLVEIASTPDGIIVPHELPHDLQRAASSVSSALAVVSGREIADLDRLLAPAWLPLAGSHGAHRRGMDGRHHDLASRYDPVAMRIAAELEPLLAQHPALILERKSGAVALHYRQAPELRDLCRSALEAAVERETGFHIVDGKMVFEARPAEIDKGAAVRAFMAEAPFSGRLPIFIGDDRTDEDGFEAVQQMGGLGIKVGDGDTVAVGRLPDVASARLFLRRIADGDLAAALAEKRNSR